MRTDYRLKAYEYIENRCFRYRLPGDEWIAEGVIRVNVSALQRAIRYEPEFFLQEEIPVAIQYGPGDWRIIDIWYPKALEKGVENLQEKESGLAEKIRDRQPEKTVEANRKSWTVSADFLLPFLWEEEDVRRYLAHWNYVVSYQERRERMNSRIAATEEGPFISTACFSGSQRLSDRVWTAILSEAPAAGREDLGDRPLIKESRQAEEEQKNVIELMTRSGRWFGMYRKQEQLYICEAKHMTPGCPITFDRRIRKKEITALLPLYEKWEMAADEEPIRRQARQVSISYEYIFAMIRQYAIC